MKEFKPFIDCIVETRPFSHPISKLEYWIFLNLENVMNDCIYPVMIKPRSFDNHIQKISA